MECTVLLGCEQCMLFDILMVQAKKDGDQTTTSITDFFMKNSTCAKSENGYYTWKCVTQKCKDCKNCPSMLLSCKSNAKETNVGQFECTHRPYKKIIEGKEIEKISIKTEKVMHSKPFREIYNLLSSSRNVYLMHKYQI